MAKKSNPEAAAEAHPRESISGSRALARVHGKARARGVRVRTRRCAHPAEEAVSSLAECGASVRGARRFMVRRRSSHASAHAAPATAHGQLACARAAGAPAAEDLHVIKSPIVGTFYSVRQPGGRSVRHRRRAGDIRAGALHHRSDEADERNRVGRGRRNREDLRRKWPAGGVRRAALRHSPSAAKSRRSLSRRKCSEKF